MLAPNHRNDNELLLVAANHRTILNSIYINILGYIWRDFLRYDVRRLLPYIQISYYFVVEGILPN